MRHFAQVEMDRQRSDALVRKNNMREKVKEMEKTEEEQGSISEHRLGTTRRAGRPVWAGGSFAKGGGGSVKRRGESFRAEVGGERQKELPDWKKQRKIE